LLALPVLVQQILILTVGLSDRFLAGNYQQGTAEEQIAYQAAQTTAHYLAWFISSYTVLVSVGSTALVARFVGAGAWKDAIHATNQSLVLAVILGLIGTIAGMLGLQVLVEVLQLKGESNAFAVAYLTPLFALLIFQVLESAGIACLVGAGDTLTGMVVLGGVALINIPLAWGLSRGWFAPYIPKLDFVGIALGTALSHVLGCCAVLAVLWHGRAGLRLDVKQLRPDPALLRRLLRVSLPAGVDSLSTVVGQLWFLSLVNRLGDVAAGAHGIALGWEALGYLSGAAFGTAAMALVGQNLGAGQPHRAAQSGWVAFALGCGVMSFMGVMFYVFAPEMFALFCPHESQRPVIDAGVQVLQLVAYAMPPLASTIIFTYALRGAGDTRMPVLFTWIGFLLVRIPLAYYLAFPTINLGPLGVWEGCDLKLRGAWLAMVADLLIRGIFFLYRFASGRWQLIRV
jgi:putative MATE family efflux protein